MVVLLRRADRRCVTLAVGLPRLVVMLILGQVLVVEALWGMMPPLQGLRLGLRRLRGLRGLRRWRGLWRWLRGLFIADAVGLVAMQVGHTGARGEAGGTTQGPLQRRLP